MNHKDFHFTQIPGKTNDMIFLQCFWAIRDHFWSFFPKKSEFFPKIWLSHTTIYGPLTPCKVSEKTNEPIPRQHTDRRKDRWKDGWKDGRTDPIL